MNIVDIVYLIGSAIAVLAVLAKLRRGWGSPQLWAVRVTFALVATIAWACTPSTIRFVNGLTGVPNFAAIFVYCLNVAFAATTLILAMFWGYPSAVAWPKVRIIVAVYAAAIVVMVGLFSQSSVPVERILDFETYYARQPTVAALLLIFNGAAVAAMGIICVRCLTWARSPDYVDQTWLRRGLRAYGVGCLFALCEFLEGFVAVIVAAAGRHELDKINEAIPVLFSLPGLTLGLVGVLLPIWGPRWSLMRDWLRKWRSFRALRPLHRALEQAMPGIVFVAPGKRFDPHHRVRRQLIELSDFWLALAPSLDPAVADAARHLGEQAALSAEDLRATVQAAQIRAALMGQVHGDPNNATGHSDVETVQDGTTMAGELDRWERVSCAFATSPIVTAARAQSSSSDPAGLVA